MKRIALLALAALCAAALSAVAASGASAAETTDYTCVSGGTEFGNEHCSTGYPGFGPGWHHVAVSVAETTQLTVSGLKTPTFESTVALATVELEGTEVECIGCHFTNNGSVGAMKVWGFGGRLKIKNVVVKKLEAKCEVHPPATPGEPGVIETEPLKFETIATNEAKFEPEVGGGALAKFEITAKTGQKCNIAGKYEITGTATGTTFGSTATFNVTLASGALKLNGEPASLTTELTISGGPTGAEHHPLALT